MSMYSHTESSWGLLDRRSSGSLTPKTRVQLGQLSITGSQTLLSTASEGPCLRGTPAMQQPSGRTSRFTALQSWCCRGGGGGGEPELEKEEEMGAPVVQRQSCPSVPRLGKALALRPPPRQAPSEECGGLRRERRNTPKGGRWLLCLCPHCFCTICSCSPHPACPSWAQAAAHSASTLQLPPH